MTVKQFITLIVVTMLYSVSLEAAPPSDQSMIERRALILETVKNQAEIQSFEDLQAHLKDPHSPIHKLSSLSKQEFLDSIVFTKKGLGSLSYGPLLELSNGDIYRIAKLLGVQFELTIVNPKVMDKGDRSTFELLACDGDTDCIGDNDKKVCVQSGGEDGPTSCEPLRFSQCFDGC